MISDLIIENGDLSISSFGTLAVAINEDAVHNNVMRRLQTSSGQFSRWVMVNSNLQLIDNEYKNEAISLVSAPLDLVHDSIINLLTTCITLDPRITLNSISILPSSISSFNVELSYTITSLNIIISKIINL